MLMIAFWLAIVLFFISKPESVKRGVGIACIVVCVMSIIDTIGYVYPPNGSWFGLENRRLLHFFRAIHKTLFFGDNLNPLNGKYIYRHTHNIWIRKNPREIYYSIRILLNIIEAALAYFTMTFVLCFSKDENGKLKISVKNIFASENRYDDEIPIESVAAVINAKYGDNADNSENNTITRSEKMEYRVEEVSAGLCTGTLRGSAIESKINMLAKQGWKFEQCETIVGRFCLFFARYKAVIVFSKPSA